MKNIVTIVLSAILLFSFSSCEKGSNYTTKQPTLSSELDSLNYYFGKLNGDGIKSNLLANDSTGKALKSFLKGLSESLSEKEDSDENVQTLGTASNIGNEIGIYLSGQKETGLNNDSTIPLNYTLVRQGLINGLKGYDGQMTGEEAMNYFQTTFQRINDERVAESYQENKLAGENFLKENANNTGVIVTESGLQYKVLKEGKGNIPTANDRVTVHYHGTLIDGTVFDSSVDRGNPATFPVTGVIKGWIEALQLMPVGSKWTLYIPQELAYGSADQGTIKPFSTLIFDVELLSIEK